MLNLAVSACFRSVQAALLQMIGSGSGGIVTNSSITALVTVVTEPIYTESNWR